MKKKIALLAGDGIGPEVMKAAVAVLERAIPNFYDRFEFLPALIGGAAFEETGTHFPEETLSTVMRSDAVLFGSVGGPIKEAHLPKWNRCEANSILALRKALALSTNIRPVQVLPQLAHLSSLKEEKLQNGVDLVLFRELSGGVYFGKRGRSENSAFDTEEYSARQIVSITHHAFQYARTRQRKVVSVDKANVLDTSKLWREIVSVIAAEYPEVTLEHMLVDNCAMQLVLNPSQFDVILTSNLFGDILSDIAAAVSGSLGLLASASLGENGRGLFEPPGGSAPDIAGTNKANPIGQILSAALLLRMSFGLDEEARRIERAVNCTLCEGYRTADIAKKGELTLSTEEITERIIENL